MVRSSTWYNVHSLQLIVASTLLLMLVGCAAPTVESPSTEENTKDVIQHTEVPTVREEKNWMIFKERSAKKIGGALWQVQAEGFWTPSTDDVMKVENGIYAFLRQNADVFSDEPPPWEIIDEYWRQYIGYEQSGRKMIFGNFLCSHEGKDWQKEFVGFLDGGECYFQVVYDVEQEAFTRLYVNGES